MSAIETKLQPQPTCPYCGHCHDSAFEWDFGPCLDGDTTHDCDDCGKEFEVERVVTTEYTTKKMRERAK